MPQLTFRFSDEEIAQLDRLKDAVRTRYEQMAVTMPRFSDLARETTRSSALRDLLAAWDNGQADTAFQTQNEAQDD